MTNSTRSRYGANRSQSGQRFRYAQRDNVTSGVRVDHSASPLSSVRAQKNSGVGIFNHPASVLRCGASRRGAYGGTSPTPNPVLADVRSGSKAVVSGSNRPEQGK